MIAMTIYLLTAHFLGDFILQTNEMVAAKSKRRLKGATIYLHSGIVASTSWILIGDIRFWSYALALFLTHILIDFFKTQSRKKLWSFIFDQAAHIAVIFGVAWIASQHMVWSLWGYSPDVLGIKIPSLVCAAIICTAPSNIFIREVLKEFRVNTSKRSGGAFGEKTSMLRNSGALIGMLERLLILFFVLSKNFEAVGLTVAAKSLLRFRDEEGPRAEFVLVGTLLSFTIAVGVAALLLAFVFKRSIIP